MGWGRRGARGTFIGRLLFVHSKARVFGILFHLFQGDLNVVLLLLKRNNTDFIFSSRIALRARQPQVPWAAALGLFQAVDWSGCPRLSPGARSRGPAVSFLPFLCWGGGVLGLMLAVPRSCLTSLS